MVRTTSHCCSQRHVKSYEYLEQFEPSRASNMGSENNGCKKSVTEMATSANLIAKLSNIDDRKNYMTFADDGPSADENKNITGDESHYEMGKGKDLVTIAKQQISMKFFFLLRMKII